MQWPRRARRKRRLAVLAVAAVIGAACTPRSAIVLEELPDPRMTTQPAKSPPVIPLDLTDPQPPSRSVAPPTTAPAG